MKWLNGIPYDDRFLMFGVVELDPNRKMYIFNEGGKHLTITFIPGQYLRVYLFGHVFECGCAHNSPKNQISNGLYRLLAAEC